MSITADPLFVAAEVAWRTENLSSGLATATPARHHGHAIRTALGRVVTRTATVGTPPAPAQPASPDRGRPDGDRADDQRTSKPTTPCRTTPT